MGDFNYDAAANRFYDTLDIRCSPMNSWDLYSSYFDTLCQCSADVVKLRSFAKKNNWRYQADFKVELFEKEKVIIITDPQLRIVYASQNMRGMNGFAPDEVLGKRPKMFQGEASCKETTKRIGVAIKNQDPFEAVIVNYRKDGSPYKCWIKAEPVVNTSGEVVHFIAYEKEVA